MLTSCEHKDFCYNHPEHSPRYSTLLSVDYDLSWEKPLEQGVDWPASWPGHFGVGYDELRPSIPAGLRVSSYDTQGRQTHANIPTFGGEVFLSPGLNSFLVYNNDTEYIVFSGMSGYATATATTRSRSRTSYTGNPLYVPSKSPRDGETDEVLKALPDQFYCNYVADHFQDVSTTPPVLNLTMHPMVYTYVVEYRFTSGQEYVALARGALAGMAESVYLHSGRTSKESATMIYDADVKTWGALARVNTFGVPDYPKPDYSRAEGSFALNLEVKLFNGKVLNYYFDVSDQVNAQPRGGVITVDDIVVTPEQAKPESGGAFDVDVGSWGEFEDVDMEL